MKPIEVSILILSVVVVLTVQNPLSLHNNNPEDFHDGGHQLIEPSAQVDYNRLVSQSSIFNPSTSFVRNTSVTIVASVTTCTTSTAALPPCSASGRRRRRELESQGFLLNPKNEENRSGIISLSPSPTENEGQSVRPNSDEVEAAISFAIEPSLSSGHSGQNLRGYGSPTVTLMFTATVTATCSSTTGFQTCGSAGK